MFREAQRRLGGSRGTKKRDKDCASSVQRHIAPDVSPACGLFAPEQRQNGRQCARTGKKLRQKPANGPMRPRNPAPSTATVPFRRLSTTATVTVSPSIVDRWVRKGPRQHEPDQGFRPLTLIVGVSLSKVVSFFIFLFLCRRCSFVLSLRSQPQGRNRIRQSQMGSPHDTQVESNITSKYACPSAYSLLWVVLTKSTCKSKK